MARPVGNTTGTTTPTTYTQWVRLGPFPSSYGGCDPGTPAYLYGSLTPEQSWTVDGALVGLSSGTAAQIMARLTQLGVRDRFGDFVCAGAAVPTVVPGSAVSAFARNTIPTPGVRMNPDDHGLAQLETWLWYDGPTSFAPISATLTATDGTSVTGTAVITFRDICWRISDWAGQAPRGCTYTSTRAGSEQDPAATHVFGTTGAYRVEITTRWNVTFTATGASTPPSQAVEVTSSRRYDVTEVRAVRQ